MDRVKLLILASRIVPSGQLLSTSYSIQKKWCPSVRSVTGALKLNTPAIDAVIESSRIGSKKSILFPV